MKILLVGALSNYAIERFYLKYFNEVQGIQADIFKAQEIFLKYYEKSILNKLIFRLGYKKIYIKINAGLKEKIFHYTPDVLFVFKGMEIYPGTLQWAKQNGVKIVNYNPDNPFIFSGKGSGNKNITQSVSLYNLHFTYNPETKNELEKKYPILTYRLPFGFDIPQQIYDEASKIDEIVKVCFVGNPDKDRALFLNTLAENKIQIDVYGSHWNKFINNKNITLFPPVYNEELWYTLRKYRIQLNPLRIHNLNSHGMRSFEVPAIGGIMLAPRTQDHIEFFEEGREAFYYKDFEEAIRNIKYLLSLEKEKANEIRNAARIRSLSSGYDYKSRAEFAINILKEL